jgi:hypothetical protein
VFPREGRSCIKAFNAGIEAEANSTVLLSLPEGDRLKRGSGPSSNAGIYQLYKERYDAQQAGAQQTPPAALIDVVPPSSALVTAMTA